MSTNSFEEAIINAINKGDDADTVGAVTGMIAGRMHYTHHKAPGTLLRQAHMENVIKHLLKCKSCLIPSS
jgi:ADP-ribosylglycohydrolase